jgi:uridine monophosphate synthetase
MSEFSKSGREEELVLALHDREIIKFGEFTLKSGRKSPIYYNQRPLLSRLESKDQSSHSRDINLAVMGYVDRIFQFGDEDYEHLYGIPQAATALGALVASRTADSYLWGRVGKKDYGKHEVIEGFYEEGDKVLQIDDVITNADSKLESAASLKEAGLDTVGFVVMFDREEGGRQVVEEAGYSFSSVTTISRTVSILKEHMRVGWLELELLDAYHEGLKAEGINSTYSPPS